MSRVGARDDEDTRAAEDDCIRISDVAEGDTALDGSGGTFVCTPDELRLTATDDPIRVPLRDVEDARVDVDRSVAGFRAIGGVFAVAAALMAYVFAKFVVLGGGPLVSVVGLGSGASSVLSVYGAVWMGRLGAGERVVLQVDCADGERYVFSTREADGGFEAVDERLP